MDILQSTAIEHGSIIGFVIISVGLKGNDNISWLFATTIGS